LDVTGAARFNGGATASTFDVTNTARFNGGATASTIDVTNAARFNGGATASTIDVTNAARFNGGATASVLDVNGAARFNGGLSASTIYGSGGSTFAGVFYVGGGATFAYTTDHTGEARFSGGATASTIDVTNAARFNGGATASVLDVIGTARFSGGLTATNIYGSGGSTFASNVIVGGCLGIGISISPSYKLQVLSSGGTSVYSESNGGVGSTNYAIQAAAAGNATNNTGLYINVSAASNNYGVRIVNPPAALNNWAIYSDAAAQVYLGGSLGVGVANPQAKFHVDAPNHPYGILGIFRNTSTSSRTGAQLQFTQNSFQDWVIGQPGGVDAFAFWNNRNTTQAGNLRLTIDALGNVNIPATTASSSVTTGGLTLGGGLGVAGAIYAGGVARVTDSTASSSTSTGALVVSGGVGVGGAITSSSLSTGAITSTSLSTGAITSSVLSTFAGITSSAIISCATAPTEGQHLANKTYVDAADTALAATVDSTVSTYNTPIFVTAHVSTANHAAFTYAVDVTTMKIGVPYIYYVRTQGYGRAAGSALGILNQYVTFTVESGEKLLLDDAIPSVSTTLNTTSTAPVDYQIPTPSKLTCTTGTKTINCQNTSWWSNGMYGVYYLHNYILAIRMA
jgi:hypothetical protein